MNIEKIGSLTGGREFGNVSITDIYFLESAQYKYIVNYACEQLSGLKNVYLPSTMEKIGKGAF
jgi:hypothetical protein